MSDEVLTELLKPRELEPQRFVISMSNWKAFHAACRDAQLEPSPENFWKWRIGALTSSVRISEVSRESAARLGVARMTDLDIQIEIERRLLERGPYETDSERDCFSEGFHSAIEWLRARGIVKEAEPESCGGGTAATT